MQSHWGIKFSFKWYITEMMSYVVFELHWLVIAPIKVNLKLPPDSSDSLIEKHVLNSLRCVTFICLPSNPIYSWHLNFAKYFGNADLIIIKSYLDAQTYINFNQGCLPWPIRFILTSSFFIEKYWKVKFQTNSLNPNVILRAYCAHQIEMFSLELKYALFWVLDTNECDVVFLNAELSLFLQSKVSFGISTTNMVCFHAFARTSSQPVTNEAIGSSNQHRNYHILKSLETK